MSLAPISPLFRNSGTNEIAPPTAPNAVIGNAIASGDLNPNNGSRINVSFSPNHGKNPTYLYKLRQYNHLQAF